MSTQVQAKSGFNFQDNKFYLHKFQEDAWQALINPDYREIALLAGIQGGKTSFGALATTKQIGILRKIHPECNFIVAADTYKTLSQATVPTLMKFTRMIGNYNQGKQEIDLKGGGKIFLRTNTDPDSVEGIPDCAFAWIDEAGKCSKLFQVNVLGRVARLKGKVLYTSTPYALNWLYTDVEKPCLSGDRKDIKVIRFSSADNPSFPKDEFERQRAILDPKTFRRKYMGLHERMEGLVYELTDDNYMEPRQLPKGTRIFAGVDFGFTEGHEFALIIRAITPDGFHIDIDEFKQAGLDPAQQAMLCRSKMDVFHVEQFYCDPARPDMIATLNKAGCSAMGFHIGNESFKQIVPGINKQIELIRSGRYKIIKGACPHLEDEFETYHWPEYVEGRPDKEVPIKLNDNLMDALRYLTVGTMNLKLVQEAKPFVSRAYHTIDRFDPTKATKAKRSWEAY